MLRALITICFLFKLYYVLDELVLHFNDLIDIFDLELQIFVVEEAMLVSCEHQLEVLLKVGMTPTQVRVPFNDKVFLLVTCHHGELAGVVQIRPDVMPVYPFEVEVVRVHQLGEVSVYLEDEVVAELVLVREVIEANRPISLALPVLHQVLDEVILRTQTY